MLATMEELYGRWAEEFDWRSSTALTLRPASEDRGLIHGVALRRAKRSTALDFYNAAAEDRAAISAWVLATDEWLVLAVCQSVALQPLDHALAVSGARMLTLGGIELKHVMVETGILEGEEPDLLLRRRQYDRIFQDVAYVFFRPEQVCTCRAFGLHGQCEHQLYAESVSHATRIATRAFDALPETRRSGRPLGSTTKPRGAAAVRGAVPDVERVAPPSKRRRA